MSEMTTTRTRRTVRDAIFALMAARNWSQAEAAKSFGVTQPTISRWLTGDRRPRTRAARHRLLDLGVDPRCL
jgi:transcriptional regulator with XRE-family HTH domain